MIYVLIMARGGDAQTLRGIRGKAVERKSSQ
jgi:hypothetical protein